MAGCAALHAVFIEIFRMAGGAARMDGIFQGKDISHIRSSVVAIGAVLRRFFYLRAVVAYCTGQLQISGVARMPPVSGCERYMMA